MRIELSELIERFPERNTNSHKGTYGKVLNVAGSKFYPGAAILSSISALKVGAGYVRLACPDIIATAVAGFTPDITLLPLRSFNNEGIASDNTEVVLQKSNEYDVVSMGSGLSDNSSTQEFILRILEKLKTPLILDADGLNTVATNSVQNLPKNTVITPHPKELSRLINVDVQKIQEEREKYAKFTSEKFNCITVLKGMNTIVTNGNQVYTNKSGNSALAKAGTGDVLTGMISGLYAQTKDLFSSACFGVYLHGLAADIAKNSVSEYSLTASELVNYIPTAIIKFLNNGKISGKI